ncbi:hypothetical protein BV97_04225 [Novosphingobium resinovorum]|uniref:Uncharacterized protein n=2 Tax=Novosphingobium resinovorum TaxID=158500 RepID=A0A031JQH4_9SPHN|nr:hypothetical protein BV97_04225 [Novosphingobium resinovorum]
MSNGVNGRMPLIWRKSAENRVLAESINSSQEVDRTVPYSALAKGLLHRARIVSGMIHFSVPRSPSALTAIAAVLALSAIPAAAQEVQAPATTPSLSLPQDISATPPSAAPATTPNVTLPPESTAPLNVPTDTATTAGTAPTSVTPTQQQTVVLPDVPPPATPDEAAAEPSSTAARTRTTTRVSAAPRAERAAPVQPTVPTAQDNGTAGDGTLAQGSVPPAAPAPARAEVPPPAAQPAPPTTDGDGFPVAEVAGILAALGVAGVGIAAMRRRRSDPVYEEAEYVPEPLEPVGALEPVPAPAPVVEAVHPAVAEPIVAEPVPVQRDRVIAGNSATAILAASPLPQTPEERYELLDAMAAAEPDEGNPFTSRKGRLRRARLQLQHRESLEAEGKAGNRFDFRTYRPSIKTPGASTPATNRELTDA